jgi:hypothetical protein
MANPNKEERFRAAIAMFKVPAEDATLEERAAFLLRVSPREPALRAFYNQHQKTGCKCEQCKTAEAVFAWISKVGNPAMALILLLVRIWHSLGWKT